MTLDASDREYEQQEVEAIKEWENTPPGSVTRVVSKIAKPFSWALGKLVPPSAIEGALRGSDWLGRLTVPEGWIMREAGVSSMEQLKDQKLQKLDELADQVHNWAIGVAVAEGGLAGWFGAAALPADIPAVVTWALRTIRSIGACYGYAGSGEDEQRFVFNLLSVASAGTLQEKVEALMALQAVMVAAGRPLVGAVTATAVETAADNALGAALIDQIAKLAERLGYRFSTAKIGQLAPFFGAGVGAAINGKFIDDVARAARREYQRRWLADQQRFEVETA